MTLACFVALTFVFYVNFVQAVLYDLSNGDYDVLEYPCPNGPPGVWTFEVVTLYPGGPEEGTVLTSAKNLSACLITLDSVSVTSESVFYIQVRLPYTTSEESMQVWIVKEGEFYQEWFKVTGPVTPGEEWVEFGVAAPNGTKNEDYKIEIWDKSEKDGISIRYFEITDEPRTTSFTTDTTEHASTTEMTSTSVLNKTEQDSTTSTVSEAGETTRASPEISSKTSSERSSTTQRSTTTPDPTVPPPGGFVLNGWSVVVGVAIGVLLMTSLFCTWVLCVRWRRDPVTLPRLEVISSRSKFMRKQLAWGNDSRTF